MSASIQEKKILTDPIFRVVFTYIWFLLGAAITILCMVFLFLGGDFSNFSARPHLTVFVELVAVGLVPIVFVLLAKEDTKLYGFTRDKLALSLLLGILAFIFKLCYNYIRTSFDGPAQFLPINTPDYAISFPGNFIFPLLALLAYGPLEVFFVVFLVVNTENMFKEKHTKVLSKSIFVTTVLFGFMHILTTRSIENAVTIFVIFTFLMLIYKYTGNIYGPMLAWTLINSYNWYVVQWLFL